MDCIVSDLSRKEQKVLFKQELKISLVKVNKQTRTEERRNLLEYFVVQTAKWYLINW